MELVTADLVEDRKSDRRGRKRFHRDERERLLREFPASGMTLKAFAEHHGVNYDTLTGWRQKAGLSGRAATSAPLELAEVDLSPAFSSTRLEVLLPDGTRVCGTDAGQVAELVKRLRGLR